MSFPEIGYILIPPSRGLTREALLARAIQACGGPRRIARIWVEQEDAVDGQISRTSEPLPFERGLAALSAPDQVGTIVVDLDGLAFAASAERRREVPGGGDAPRLGLDPTTGLSIRWHPPIEGYGAVTISTGLSGHTRGMGPEQVQATLRDFKRVWIRLCEALCAQAAAYDVPSWSEQGDAWSVDYIARKIAAVSDDDPAALFFCASPSRWTYLDAELVMRWGDRLPTSRRRDVLPSGATVLT